MGPKIDLTDDTIEPNLNDKHTESILVDNSHDFSDGEADEDKHEAPSATEKSQADNFVKASGKLLNPTVASDLKKNPFLFPRPGAQPQKSRKT